MATFYERQLAQGKEFEQYIYQIFKRIGFKITPCETKRDQYLIGENHEGIEIKRDNNFRTTGNLFIEYQEKDKNGNWINSGILRDDNTILYLIGDEKKFHVFKKEILKQMYLNVISYKLSYRNIPNTTDTAKGILLPISDVQKGLYNGFIHEVL